MNIKVFGRTLGVGAAALLLVFILGLISLGLYAFFAPRAENVRRNVFENTKSYTHGVIQDLGKYYDEYQGAKTPEDKAVIKQIIKVRFAEFNANKIDALTLRSFLKEMRGY